MWRSRETEQEVYRFTWNSSFHGDARVHIGRNGGSIRLRWHKFGASAASLALSLADWQKMQQAFDAVHFSSIESDHEITGDFDGAQWLIDGRRGNIFHAPHYCGPGGAVHELGRMFFALSGPPLARIKLC